MLSERKEPIFCFTGNEWIKRPKLSKAQLQSHNWTLGYSNIGHATSWANRMQPQEGCWQSWQ